MEHIVYFSEDIKCTLTTDSPVSSYGIPAMRMYGRLPGCDFIDADFGPRDSFPNGLSAADLCYQTYHLQDEDTQAASRAFCAQWPDGPQPGEEK